MLSVTRHELGKLLSGEADGVTREYPSGCPHKPGDKMVLTSRASDTTGQSDEAFAGVVVTSVRPCRIGDRKKDNRLAKMDGFANGMDWYMHFSKVLYRRDFDDAETVFRLQLRMEKMEKDEPEEMLPMTGMN